MSEERPLHVLVAAALLNEEPLVWHWSSTPVPHAVLGKDLVDQSWWCFKNRPPGAKDHDHQDDRLRIDGEVYWLIPRYDTDWAATGPLIEKYVVNLWRRTTLHPWYADGLAPNDRGFLQAYQGEGETPLIAVCNLILELGKAGKL